MDVLLRVLLLHHRKVGFECLMKVPLSWIRRFGVAECVLDVREVLALLVCVPTSPLLDLGVKVTLKVLMVLPYSS